MNRSWLRPYAALAAVLVGLPALPTDARAQPSTPTVTWAVQPADRDGPDGRRWVERTLDPGQVVTEHLAVRNFGDAPVVFSLKAADGYLTDKGRFNMLPSHQTSVDGGTWISVQETVTVGPKATRVVPYTITVPDDATPGDHPAGIAATVTSADGTVAVESRVGFRVLLRASGTVAAALTVADLTATYRSTWNPFAAGALQVRYTAVNDGGVAVTGAGRVTAAGPFGLAERNVRAGVEELLPGGRRATGTRVGGVWGWGPVRTTVELTPAVRGGDPTGVEIRPGRTTVTVWAFPWAQLALALLLVVLGLVWRAVARRRRRRLAALLARARQEGRDSVRAG
ncbi:hypothetical protein O7606_03415 [Micromonospora sp. WMMD882]|uniref:hypothetical protein n=1 Tax=Micromonospora sp. WMMD882 TaxID=3015151 RepID=UPI00248D2D30|nr:hypothetical protein [Micromonospora sp. WMMD882]WBB80445.1 hypothetical protein O7606_03415 [Micromonospora sp. WMMD882]